jgi:hypothetical protein
MSWRDWIFPPKASTLKTLTADATILMGPSSDTNDDAPRRNIYHQATEWQREVWDFYDSLGEFRQGVQWKANMMSRVRLVAARRKPGSEDPEVVTSGPVADLVADLAGGIGGQAALMSSFSTYFDTPGECYLIGETLPSAVNKWYVRSIDEVKRAAGTDVYEVAEDRGRWRRLPNDSMVVRVWRPHKRYHAVADSPARAARTLMRELELLNRHIQSQYMSRLASAGVILFPDEVTFPVRPEFADEPDPFVAEWIEIAAEAIRTPGTAAAVVPIPIKVPGEYVDKIRHIDFTLKLDDRIVEKRDSALTRLAIALDMPPEALLGTRGVNHWCTPRSTQALTRDRGWVTHDQLTIGDVVLTLNHDSGLSEWQPVQAIYRADVVDEPMRRFTGRFSSAITTLQHRWPVVSSGHRTWKTSETLQPEDRVLLGARSSDVPTERKYTDAFIQLVAWMTTDGTFRRWQDKYHGNMQAVLGQSHIAHPENCVEIRQVLTELMGSSSSGKRTHNDTMPRWREQTHVTSGMTTWVLNRVAAEMMARVMSTPAKIVSREFIYELTHAQLELFVQTFVRGDGSTRAQSLISSQRASERLDAFELAGVLCGYVTGRSEHTSSGFKSGVMHEQRLVHPDNYVVPGAMVKVGSQLEDTTYTGTIWCPTTANGTWFAREDGRVFITGNSAWLIDEQGVKIHVAPTVELVCDALTTGYLTPRLLAAGEDPNEWIIWYDATSLILRPDRSQDATDTYDRLELSGEALRREHGFDESDAPSEDELRDIILKKASLQPVNTFQAMDELGMKVTHDTPPAAPRPAEEPAPTQDKKVDPGPPDAPLLQPEKAVSKTDIAKILTHQAGLMHVLRVTTRGDAVSTDVLHPKDCTDHLFSCPVTHAMWKPHISALPGTTGLYRCWLNAYGQPIIGERVFVDTTRDMVMPSLVRSNGVAH